MKEYNFNFKNTYSSLGEIFFTHLEPVPVARPKLVIFNEDLATSIGLDLSSIKDAEKRTGLSVDASKNNKNNPVSGDNIRKRLQSQKKRKN